MILVIVAFVVFFALAVAAVLARGKRTGRRADAGPPSGIPERRENEGQSETHGDAAV